MKIKWCHRQKRDKEFSCDGKIKYRELSATEAAARMTVKHQKQFDAYECEFCSGWHIGKHKKVAVISIRIGSHKITFPPQSKEPQ